MIPGHNLPLAGAGTLIMLVGWIPYIAGAGALHGGSPLAVAAVNVLLGVAASGTATICYSCIRFGKPDIVLILSGMLGGMVSLCAGGAVLPVWAAVATGAVAGLIVPLAINLLDLHLRIDDPLGIISIHAVGGAWGTLAAGIFVPALLARSRFQQVGIQCVGIIAIAFFSGVVALLVCLALKVTLGLHIKEVDDFEGLDLAEHDIGAYPDFQQNSIKSYHLRET
jgi:Amt family ammonium transporter